MSDTTDHPTIRIDSVLATWRTVAGQARDQFGHGASRAPAAREGSGSSTPAPARPSRWDGTKLTHVLVDRLAAELRPHVEELALEQWDSVESQMDEVVERLIATLEGLDYGGHRPPLAAGRSPALSDFRRWLLKQRLPLATDHVGDEAAPVALPFVILPAMSSDRASASVDALWLEHVPALFMTTQHEHSAAVRSGQPSFWDAKRGQLTLAHPHVLLYRGALDQEALRSVIIPRLREEQSSSLVVLAVDCTLCPQPDVLEETPMVVLPAPRALGSLIAELGLPDETSIWLGRWQAAQIDGRRAALLPEPGSEVARRLQAERLHPLFPTEPDWRVRPVVLLGLPEIEPPTSDEGVKAINWRLEAAGGLVADGGAALAWLATRMPSPESPCARAWQAALGEPLRQILRNYEAIAYEPAIFAWVTGGEGPWRAYHLLNGQDDRRTHEPPVRVELGECLELGVVTPLAQVKRVLRQAADTALHQLFLERLDQASEPDPESAPGLPLCPPAAARVMQREAEVESPARMTDQQPGATALPRFYMSKSDTWPYVPAAGLYYYQPDPSGSLTEFIVGFNGVPSPTGMAVPKDRLPRATWAGTRPHEFDSWVVMLPGEQEAYLATVSLVQEQPGYLDLQGLERIDCEQGVAYALSSPLRNVLTAMLTRRYQGYTRFAAMAEERTLTYGHLAENAVGFYQSLIAVSNGLVQRIGEDFVAQGAGDRGHFTNPELIFQLSRHLSEGFIEGHAAAIKMPPAGYAVPEESRSAWQQAIARASRAPWKISYRSLDAEEDRVFDLVCEQVVALVPPFKLLPAKLYRRGITAMLGLAMPGHEAEDIVFWELHYPHWFIDLVGALRALAGDDGRGPELDDRDIDVIAEIIMEAYAALNGLLAFGNEDAKDLGKPVVCGVMRSLRERATRPARV